MKMVLFFFLVLSLCFSCSEEGLPENLDEVEPNGVVDGSEQILPVSGSVEFGATGVVKSRTVELKFSYEGDPTHVLIADNESFINGTIHCQLSAHALGKR